MKVRAVQAQGQVVVKTVEDFQKVATAAQSETATLVNDVRDVFNKVREVKQRFDAAFNDIPTCSSINECRIPRVSHFDFRHAYNLIYSHKTSRQLFLVLTKRPIDGLCE